MYTKYFGLEKRPFESSPDPKFLYLSESHKEAFAHLKYGVQEKKGFVVITGNIGTGKTTLLNALLHDIDLKIRKVHLTDPGMTVQDLFYMVRKSLNLPVDDLRKGKLLWDLNDFLKNELPEDERVLLVVDEAQRLSPCMLEEIRLLSNVGFPDKRLFQIFLVGQEDLNGLLQAPELRQVRQRVGVKYHLTPLDLADTKKYIQHRLEVAGYNKGGNIFDKRAVKEIHRFSKGYPRIINILCDSALLVAYSKDLREVRSQVIEEIKKDIKVSYFLPAKRQKGHTRTALAIILIMLSTGLPYGIYRNGGMSEIIPSFALYGKNIETPFDSLEIGIEAEEMKAKKPEADPKKSSDSSARVTRNNKLKKEFAEDLVGLKDMDPALKAEEEMAISNSNEFSGTDQAQLQILEEIKTKEGNSRTLKKADTITEISSSVEGDVVKITLVANGVISKYETFSLDEPTRVVIDVFNITRTLRDSPLKINSPHIDRIRIGTHPDRVRLCLDCSGEKPPPHCVLTNDRWLMIVVGEENVLTAG